ncbi:hypothetical protein RB595_004285 [Gaeumannomyces hyphopodioides]
MLSPAQLLAVGAMVLALANPALACPTTTATNATSPAAAPNATQLLSYIKRKPGMSREEFWDHWHSTHAPIVAPLATKFGINGYSQMRAFGQILPQNAGEEAPVSSTLTSFDGIAFFQYRDPAALTAMLAHPYYAEVVAVDEANFIDKGAHNGGQVAVYLSEIFDVVGDGHADENLSRDVWKGDDAIRIKYRDLFEEYDKRVR